MDAAWSAAGNNDLRHERALALIRRLREDGFAGYLAGGYVRDRVLGLSPKDYDIATDAKPEVVQRLFPNHVAVGAKFGVIMVMVEGDAFEVATFRADLGYLDGRRPSGVRFGSIEADAQRRDFTIGGMYYDPMAGQIIDLVGGMRDLRAGIVRAIGSPGERFAEDRLRMLRAVRFAARLDFTIEAETLRAIRDHAGAITEVSAERIGEELTMIMTEGGAARGLDLLRAAGLMEVLLPEVEAMVGCDQPANFHPEGDVYRHTRLAVSMLGRACSETLAFGVLFHDVAKPPSRAVAADGKITFYGHTQRGAEMASDKLRALRRSRMVQERVAYLVHNHLRLTDAPRMRPATFKRMLAEQGFDELLELALIDALASNSHLGFYHFCRKALSSHDDETLRPKPLISGHDLIALGLVPGPQFRLILQEVFDLQLDGTLTTREQALQYVRTRPDDPSTC